MRAIGSVTKLIVAVAIATTCLFANAQAQSILEIIDALSRGVERSDGSRVTGRAAVNRTLWVVVASRTSPQDAINLGLDFAEVLGSTFVVEARNGRYAIVAGYLREDKAKQNLEALKAIRLVPADSFLSAGRDLVNIVWASHPNEQDPDLIRSATLRQSTIRLQTALSKLNLYSGEVDGRIGSGTMRAVTGYLDRFGPLPADSIDKLVLARIEQTATDGFATEADRQAARNGGFRDAATWESATRAGFTFYADFERARTLGFEGKHEYDAFKASGFSSRADFETAKDEGFSDRKAFEAYQRSTFVARSKEAGYLLDDASDFLKLNPDTPGIQELARRAGELRAAMSNEKLQLLEVSLAEFRALLAGVNGFAKFGDARQAERQVAEDKERNRLSSSLMDLRNGIQRWMAMNLTSSASVALAEESAAIEASLRSKDLDLLRMQAEATQKLLRKLGIGNDVAKLAKPNDGAPADPNEFTVAETAANAFLLKDQPNQYVVIYNAASSAPAVVRNLKGGFDFDPPMAQICAFPGEASAELKRALLADLAALGVFEISLTSTGCTTASLLQHDLLLVDRRQFLKSQPTFAVALLEQIEAGVLREFPPVTGRTIANRIASEHSWRAEIEGNIRTGVMQGYGAISIKPAPSGVCAVVSADREAHEAALAELHTFLSTEGVASTAVEYMDAQAAFRGLQRQECGYAYAAQPDLKALADGLKADGREYEVVPIWLPAEQLKQTVDKIAAAKQSADQSVQEARIAAAENARIKAEKAKRLLDEAAERVRGLRKEFATEARSLQLTFEEGLRQLMTGVGPVTQSGRTDFFKDAASDFFPRFEQWRMGLEADFWSVKNVTDTTVVEYGLANWKGRKIPAIALRSEINLVSRERGENSTRCFIFGILVDQEFDQLRDGIELDCSNEAGLGSWTRGHQLASRWNAQ